jgi:uncharacterized protein YkwD
MSRRLSTIVALVAVLGCALALAGTALGAKRNARVGNASLAVQVLGAVNQVRVQHGLVPLKLSSALSAAALQHANEMAHDGYFSHDSANGSSFWKRVQRYYASNGFGFWSVGENLLWSSPDVDATGAIKMWMESPEHRANLLTPRWREIGLAAVHQAAARGSFHGLDVTIVAADFGVRR